MLTFVVAVLSVSLVSCATSGSTCKTSFSCPANACCRDSAGSVLSNEHMGGMHFGGGPLLTNSQGTCTAGHARKGEVCDSHCTCASGLECYRPVSGICCPPMRCYDATYVQQQKQYWANCNSNPNCAYPP